MTAISAAGSRQDPAQGERQRDAEGCRVENVEQVADPFEKQPDIRPALDAVVARAGLRDYRQAVNGRQRGADGPEDDCAKADQHAAQHAPNDRHRAAANRTTDPQPQRQPPQPECDDGPHGDQHPAGHGARRPGKAEAAEEQVPLHRRAARLFPVQLIPVRLVLFHLKFGWRKCPGGCPMSDGFLSNLVLVVGLRRPRLGHDGFAPYFCPAAALSLPGDEAGAAWAAGLDASLTTSLVSNW